MSPIVSRCGCGRQYTAETWLQLEYVGKQITDEMHLELRNCPCNSTKAIVLWEAPEVES